MQPGEEGSPEACAVLRTMCDWHHPMTPDQIAQMGRLSRTAVDQALAGLCERNRVTRDGFGSDALWRLVKQRVEATA